MTWVESSRGGIAGRVGPTGTAGMTWVKSVPFRGGVIRGGGPAGTAGISSVGATGDASAITGRCGGGPGGGSCRELETYNPDGGGSSEAVSLFCEPDV